MNTEFRKAGIAGVCAFGLGVGVCLQTAAASANPEAQGDLEISEKDGKFEITGAGLALEPVGKPQKSQKNRDSDPLALSSQESTPHRGQTDEYTVVDSMGRVVDTLLDRTVDITDDGTGRTAWVRTSDSVAVEWPAAEGVAKWTVKKPNGETVTTSKTVLVDNSNAESGTYLITGTAGDGAVKSYVLTIPDSDSQGNDQEAGAPAEQNAVEPEQWRGFAWAAFIQEDKIQAKVTPWGPDACTEAQDGYYYYGGDDRGYADSVQGLYDGEEPRFRIGSGVASTWKYPAWVNPNIYDGLIGRAAGLTTAYDASGKLVDSTRADAVADIKLVRGTSEILPPNLGDLGLATREVKMGSANPLCSLPGDNDAPNIDVEYTYRHLSNGWVTVEGQHDKAPMHEAFWVSSTDEDDPNKPNGCLYRFKNQGFNWLAAPLALGADVTMDFNPDSEAPTCVTVDP